MVTAMQPRLGIQAIGVWDDLESAPSTQGPGVYEKPVSTSMSWAKS